MSTSRRDAVPFDPRHFERLARNGERLSSEEIFRDIHRRHHWSGSTSPSGAGAAEEQIARLRTELPRLLAEFGVRTLLDLPCGDYSWMATIDPPVERYIVLDLERPPFSFPPPIRLLNEGCTEGGGRFADKSLGLWRVGDLASLPMLAD